MRTALRDVVGRCIYGVDINPLAAELAKVSLWLEAMEPGKPLAFLDAQIKVGNALVGTTPALLDQGIPQEAFKPIEGDDKKVASALAKRNKDEAGGQGTLFGADEARTSNADLVEQAADLVGAGLSLADIHIQQQRLKAYETSPEYRRQRHAADAWCAAFVWRKTDDAPEAITNAVLDRLRTPDRRSEHGNAAEPGDRTSRRGVPLLPLAPRVPPPVPDRAPRDRRHASTPPPAGTAASPSSSATRRGSESKLQEQEYFALPDDGDRHAPNAADAQEPHHRRWLDTNPGLASRVRSGQAPSGR